MRWDEYLGETVRVWDAQHDSVFIEGTVIAASGGPVIWVRADDGVVKAHPVSLPIEVSRWLPSRGLTPLRSSPLFSSVGEPEGQQQ